MTHTPETGPLPEEPGPKVPTFEEPPPLPKLAARGVMGGLLMGLANLVPGISGGTMLLAAGVYPRFIQAIADVTTFRFRRHSLVLLGAVVLSALAAIGGLAGVVKDLVVQHRWVMYSLFIGLTLGGVPVVWRMGKPANRGFWLGAAAGLVGMAFLALLQARGTGTGGAEGHFGLLFLGGLAGASAMILPGVSGGYLLLLLGQYVTILAGIHEVMVALRSGSLSGAWSPIVHVVLPVGLGVLAGVVGVSNGLRWLLERYEKPTLGTLLGLLVGAVVGLWPFQAGIRPQVGDVVRGQTMTAELLDKLSPDKYPTAFFTPSTGQVLGAIALVAVGIGVTLCVDWLGREG